MMAALTVTAETKGLAFLAPFGAVSHHHSGHELNLQSV